MMNLIDSMRKADELRDLLRLVRDAERLATRPAERWRLVSELVTVEKRLEKMARDRRMARSRDRAGKRRRNAEVSAKGKKKIVQRTGPGRGGQHDWPSYPDPALETSRERR
jgi:DNA mismatch repair ATPase MutS